MSRHFERSFKSLILKPTFWWLPISILAALVLSFRPSLQGSSENDLPFGHPIQHSELSCAQVLKIADWGQKKFGGIGEKDVFNSARAGIVARVFLEKLDPRRMFFSQEDVEELKKLSQKNWSSLVQQTKCEPWQNWLEHNYPRTQQRISHWVKRFKAPRTFKPKLDKENKTHSSEKDESYTQFAASSKELEKRWQKELNGMLLESSEVLLAAYHQNLNQLLRDKVEQKYFETFPDGLGLLAKSLLGGLDPYSTYFSSKEFSEFYEELKGTTAGLGLHLEKVPQGFLVSKVVENSSAERSKKIHEGDVIEKVDEVNLDSLSFEDAKKLLKGPESSVVTLGMECHHRNSEESQASKVEVTLERTQFELEETKLNLSWKTPTLTQNKSQKVAVISIPAFYGRGGMESGAEEKSVSEDLKKRIMNDLSKDSSHLGLVLDLRGNPGGYLEEAVSMGGLFVGDKPIVGVVEEGMTRVLKDESATKPIYQKPLVVLVDQSSASAAEVLSGALKDYQRAVIVGSSRTYGKGTVQKLFHLEDPFFFSSGGGESLSLDSLGSGVVKLTTSVFYSPLGHTPANGGVPVDIVLNNQKSDAALLNKTKDILPIVDPRLRQELADASTQHQSEILYLTDRSKERLSSPQLTQQDVELSEAVAIASDLALLKNF